MRRMKRLIALVFLGSVVLGSPYARAWHTTPDRWKEPRVFHAEFDKNFDGRIRISRVALERAFLERDEKERIYSSNKAYWYVITSPNTMKAGPWSTEIKIFNERDYVIRIELIDHAANYPTTGKWINEKLFYIQFWWGRILGTYFIFDAEKEEIIIREMVCDGGIVFEHWGQKGQK